jgi:hypothetical protein
MKQCLEPTILLAIAVVSGSASFVLDPATAGLILAGLHVALAVCSGLR